MIDGTFDLLYHFYMTNQSRNQLMKFAIPLVLFFLGLAVGSWWSSKRLSPKNEDRLVYAVYKGQKIFGSDVSPKIANDLRQLEKNKYTIKKQAVQDLIQEKNPEPPLELNSIEITPTELQEFAKARNIDLSKLKGQAKTDITNNFKIHKKMLARNAELQRQMNSSDVEWRIPMTYLGPTVDIGAGKLPELGSAQGKKTLLLFSNFHCPTCKEAWGKVKNLQDIFKDNLSIRFRFAMNEQETSMPYISAMATYCANEQGKASEILQSFFQQAPTDFEAVMKFAADNNLKTDEFKTCVESKKFKSELEKDFADADKIGIRSMNAFILNGHQVQIQEPLDELTAILRQND
jgi:predicted DsbA family dithiol-disulfide isomerase